ncbi:cilia- and flagella-associated protein 61 isoform X1 [Drosophila yakuba]|uniref:cilia- and flagella-associated protein 61 isoform X1 n=2 Tax=Drosophila yakuba TaxID=7245 RepID=UPI00193082A3|nr:cilia- and flagella-associated protein 61 isoform X1 [Drosophila yakuba]
MTTTQEILIAIAGIRDQRRIEDLYEAKKTSHFGEKETPPLDTLFFRNQAQRLIVYNKQEFHLLLAYAEFANHPNIPVLTSDLWLHWLNVRFCLDLPITLLNAIFFNFFICKDGHPEMLKKVILEVFYTEHLVNYMLVVKPPDCQPGQYDSIQAFGTTFYPKYSKVSEQKHLPAVIVIQRRNTMPVLSFRKALPEDNDDIVEMIDSEDPELRKKHGDFYIAEHLLNAEGTDHNDKIIIAEFEEEIADNVKGAGLMWLSQSLDIKVLATNYHFERLGNLVRYTPGFKHAHVEFEVISVDHKSYKELFTRKQMEERYKTQVSLINEHVQPDARNILFKKYKHIYEELRKGVYYMTAYQDKLEICFDLPEGESLTSENRLQCLAKASNGFLLKMFQLHPLVRYEYTFYSLSAMFSAFPEHDYCVTLVPVNVSTSPCQRELLRFFLPVAHRPSSTVSENLFVAHRSTLFGELRVHRFESQEIDEIRILISKQARKRESMSEDEDNNVLDDYTEDVLVIFEFIIKDILENPMSELTCFTIRCGQSKKHTDCPLVGFLILRCPFLVYDDISKVFMMPRDQFTLTHKRGEIVMFRLHPFFQMWCNPILRTVALYDNYRELYYIHFFSGISLPNDLMYNMMPVEPRRMKKNLFNYKCFSFRRRVAVGKMSQTANIDICTSRMRLFCHNLQPTMHMGGKNSLVIVGFSATSMAFLRTVIFAWNSKDLINYKKYNCLPMVDITVLVGHGIVESAYDCDFSCNYCADGRNCYVDTGNVNPFVRDTMQRMDVRHWVRFVSGTMKSIKRQEKVLELSDGCHLYYEKLVLMAATRFGFEDKEFKGHPIPINYVVNNHRLDRIIFYHKVREMVELMDSYNIIVYGYNLCIYECIHFLVTHGCKAQNITYVQPHVPMIHEEIGNPELDCRLDPIILDMVADLGVTIYLSTDYSQFILSQDNMNIEKVELVMHPSNKKIVLDCELFVNYNVNTISSALENVLTDAGIEVMERRIVVNSRYCTNDRNIFAAGRNIIMIPKPNFQYTHCSPQEMAEKLAYELNMVKVVMQSRYSKPYMFTGILPMGYQIIKFTQPKPLLIGQLPIEFSETLTTYDDGDFCRIRLNKKLIVIEIVCVTKKPKRLYFMEYFCGKHAMLLNDLRGRFQSGWIQNFLEFFKQPWTELLMHDRFEDLQLKNRRLLLSMLLMNNKDNPRSSLENTQRQKLEENVIDFVRTYRKDFTHEFALPEDWGVFNL